MISSREQPQTLVVGPVMVDVTLPRTAAEPKLRLGGIMHAARALWAAGCSYGLAYYAPRYLDEEIERYARCLGATSVKKIGDVMGAPNVMLISEPKEWAEQGYEHLLRDHIHVVADVNEFANVLTAGNWADVLVLPGEYDLNAVLSLSSQRSPRVTIDLDVPVSQWTDIGGYDGLVDTVILSTSSRVFRDELGSDVARLLAQAKDTGAAQLLLKENRGGSRLFDLSTGACTAHIPAQVQPIVHSVGVGDCFDAVYTALKHHYPTQQALAFASCVASEYAATTFPDDFRAACQGWLKVPPSEVECLNGICLAWEDRTKSHIYIAAPDFDYVDTRPLEALRQSLVYHNFSPRLPVREHGQATCEATPAEKNRLCRSDLELLDKCSILVAVLLYDDPGTLIEIGYALRAGMPVIVYDPFGRAENLMLTQSPVLVSSDMDEVLVAIFKEVQSCNQNR